MSGANNMTLGWDNADQRWDAPRAPADISPKAWEVIALVCASTLDLILWLSGVNEAVNILSPLMLVAIMGAGNWQLARRHPGALWTPIFALRLCTLVFLGIGGLVPYLISQDGVDYILDLFPYSPAEAAKTNTIWMISTTLLVIGAKTAARLGRKALRGADVARRDNVAVLGAAFYGIGLMFTVFFQLPATLGASQLIIPGSISIALESLSAVGLFMLGLAAFRRGGIAIAGVLLLLIISISLAILTLSKQMVLLPEIFLALAYLMQGVNFRRAAIVVVGMSATLFVFQPMITYARSVQIAEYGGLVGGTVGSRLTHVADFFAGDRLTADEASEESLLRLTYMNSATFAVSRYDAGEPSDWPEQALVSIIPRFIWPDKPHISNAGSDLYYMLTGREGSFIGATVGADVYWGLGWPGIALVFPILGIMMMFGSNISYRIVISSDWLKMPFVLLAFRIGLNVDQMFLGGFFAPIIIAIFAYWILKAADVLVPDSHARTPVLLNETRRGPNYGYRA